MAECDGGVGGGYVGVWVDEWLVVWASGCWWELMSTGGCCEVVMSIAEWG